LSTPTVIDADGHAQVKYIRWEDYLGEPFRAMGRIMSENARRLYRH